MLLSTNFDVQFLIIDFAETAEKYQFINAKLEKSNYPYFISNIGFRGLPNYQSPILIEEN